MRRHPHLLALSILFISAAVAGSAAGQAIEWLASEEGAVLPRDPGSSRLDAMGGLSIAVPDEQRELNLYDYGRMTSGLLWDGDSRRWDFWSSDDSRIVDQTDEGGVRTRNRIGVLEYGARMSWRTGDRRALGGEYVFDQLDRSLERGDVSRTRGPRWGFFGAQRVGRLALGGSIALTSDNEDLTTTDVFSIRHKSSGSRFVGSVAYRGVSFDLGLQAEGQTNSITGLSRDESRFHEDEFTWRRPVQIYSGALVWRPTARLEGGVRGRGYSLEGRQEAQISWSDRMPSNPGREQFQARTGAFSEEGDGVEFGSRWNFAIAEDVRVAAEGEFGERSDDVIEGDNFKGSRRASSTKDSWSRAGGGASSAWMDGRLRVGVEGWHYRNVRKETTNLGDKTETTSRVIELRAGVEYFMGQNLALRAGYSRNAEDADLDAPRTLGVGNGVTIGLGYYPRGGIYAIDAAVRHSRVEPDYAGDPASDQETTTFTLAARLLL